MLKSTNLKRRDTYLNKLIGFQDTEPVKVITGIRRCGKSSLLKLMISHLIETGIQEDQILEMNFESFDFRKMSSEEVYKYVQTHKAVGKKMYLFFDELQRIPSWEDAITHFAWILTVIFILPVPMHTFYLPSTPPIFPADVWR